MKNLIIFKIGGSVLTDKNKPYTARPHAIKKIAKTLKKLKDPFIIVHGSGSFGHTSAKKYITKNGFKSKLGISLVANDTMTTNKLVTDILIEEKIPAIAFRPTSHLITINKRVANHFFEPIKLVLDNGLVPVLCGDIIWDIEKKVNIFSGEKIISELYRYFLKNGYNQIRIIQLSETNGVLDKKGKVIPEINKKIWGKIQSGVSGTNNTDVTGGMRHKVEVALELAEIGAISVVINGNKPELIKKVLQNKKTGTKIKP